MITAFFAAMVLPAAPISVTVQADSGRIPISPYIYGRNTSMKPAEFALDREAGIRIVRANGGNNTTKYNWRNGLSSHPDWYNNNYSNDWDSGAKSIQTDLPGIQGMFGFQLLGWVASNTKNNFDDWSFNGSQSWGPNGEGALQNLAGGGTVDMAGGPKAAKEGDPNKYLVAWPADSTAGILDHWFGNGGLGLDSTRFRYWNMDNEPDGWSGTHDDVVPALTGHILTAEDYVQRWVAVAKAVRMKFPAARLVGPASMSEWQWYTWENSTVKYKAKNYSFPEFFIKRLAEIQDSTKVRMIDVYDIHFYYGSVAWYTLKRSDYLQGYRLLFDRTYSNPAANGLLAMHGGWDTDTTKEFVLGRVQDWLTQYFGNNHGIGVGMTESATDASVSGSAPTAAVWHASILGALADNGGELYTAWSWYAGMYEATHLFSRYAFGTRVGSRSGLDSIVSAYSSISDAGDSLTVILVNRDPSAIKTVQVGLNGFVPSGNGASLQLSNISGETFVTHSQNGLKSGSVTVSGQSFSLDLPAMSVTAVRLAGKGNRVGVTHRQALSRGLSREGSLLELRGIEAGIFELRDGFGRVLRNSPVRNGFARLDLSGLHRGVYFATWPGEARKIVVSH